MASYNPEQLKVLLEDVEAFNRWRQENPGELINLVEANLVGANLRGADLAGADLSRTDFGGADLKGADITGTNRYKWKIIGVKCTHIVLGGKTIEYEDPRDFEKAFTEIKSVVEILLDLPFSDFTHYTGLIFENVVNKGCGEGSVKFKGQVGVADDKTRLEFLTNKKKPNTYEILMQLQESQGQIFKQVKELTKPNKPVGVASEILTKGTMGIFVVGPDDLERELNDPQFQEHFARMAPALQTVYKKAKLLVEKHLSQNKKSKKTDLLDKS